MQIIFTKNEVYAATHLVVAIGREIEKKNKMTPLEIQLASSKGTLPEYFADAMYFAEVVDGKLVIDFPDEYSTKIMSLIHGHVEEIASIYNIIHSAINLYAKVVDKLCNNLDEVKTAYKKAAKAHRKTKEAVKEKKDEGDLDKYQSAAAQSAPLGQLNPEAFFPPESRQG